MNGVLLGVIASSGPVTPSDSDPFFSDVVLLNHMDSLDGGGDFVSVVGPNGELINGSVRVTSGQKFGVSALRVDGAGDRLEFDNGIFDGLIGWDGSWTIEFWFNLDSVLSAQSLFVHRPQYAARGLAIFIDSGSYNFMAGDDDILEWESEITGGTATTGYHHCAMTFDKSTNTYRGFIDGLMIGFAVWSGSMFEGNNASWCVGSGGSVGSDAASSVGVFDEIRITAACRYTSSFTQPSLPFPNS